MENLIYINVLGKNSDSKFTYEFYFSDDVTYAWGIDWEIKPAVICNLSVPTKDNYESIKILKTEIVLNVAQSNSCFSMQDCKDGILPVAWESLDDVEEYPENGRIVFKYGISIEDIETTLSKRDLCFDENN